MVLTRARSLPAALAPLEVPELELGAVHVWQALLGSEGLAAECRVYHTQAAGERALPQSQDSPHGAWLAIPAGLTLDDTWLEEWGWLSPDELSRAAAYRFPEHRRRFVRSRLLLRALLGAYLGIEPGSVELDCNHFGKPRVAAVNRKQDVRFNLSHSEELVLIAMALGCEIGVDVECLRPVVAAGQIARRYFSPGEAAEFERLPPAERPLAFFRCWTRKEAYLKGRGSGLSLALDAFDVSLLPGEPAALRAVRGDPDEAGRWRLSDLEVPAGYVAALAVENIGDSV